MLEEQLASHMSPRLCDLGGPEMVARVGEASARSLYADRLVMAISGYEQDLPDELAQIAFAVLAENPHPFVMAAAVHLLTRARLLTDQARKAQRILIARAEQRSSPAEALLASEALAGAFLLANNMGASQPAVVAALDDIGSSDNPSLVRRVARLAGLAWLWRRSPDLTDLLLRLSANDEAGEQALHELALIQLEVALSLPTRTEAIEGLEVAARMFEAASQADPELGEAIALQHSLKAVLLFCNDGDREAIEFEIGQARRAAIDRRLEIDPRSLRTWLRPSVTSEVAWYELANLLEGLSQRLDERSWLRAVPVLQQLSKLRIALLAFADRSGDALRVSITERVAEGIVAHDGLVSHLTAWIDDPGTSDQEKQEAHALLESVETARKRSQGKDEGRANAAITARPADDRSPGDPLWPLVAGGTLSGKLEEAFFALDSELHAHDDYQNGVMRDFRILLNYHILYLAHCLDITGTMAEESFPFLFDAGSSKPLEITLQRSLWNYLCLQVQGFPQHQIVREVPDVGTGRADIAIVRPSWRMVIEVKREVSDASREGIRKYLGQAASYTLTGPRISLLVVLDLCSQKDWALTIEDNCWIEWIRGPGDSHARAVAVFRIPGMRIAPSRTSTPTT